MPNSPFNKEQIVDTELGKFVDGRRSFYEGLHIGHLAKKDLLMIGMAKGEGTITGAIKHSFAAYESSSEEGQWGTSLQAMVIYLSEATDSGDMTLTDKASKIQWIIEVKPARNTFNSDSLPQILRGLKAKVKQGNDTHTPTIKLHKPMIGVLRGNPTKGGPKKTYPGKKQGTQDLAGFVYEERVGSDFFDFITDLNPQFPKDFWIFVQDRIGANQEMRSGISLIRDNALRSVISDTKTLLEAFNLKDDIGSAQLFQDLLPKSGADSKTFKTELDQLLGRTTLGLSTEQLPLQPPDLDP